MKNQPTLQIYLYFILIMLIMCCCDGNKGNNNSYTSSNPFVGEWEGVHINKTSGVYSNETVARKYHISIYKDGTCIITESSTGEHSYIKKYEGEWKLENGSFANQRFEWIYLSGSDRITNWATNLFMTKDGNIYFPYANNGLDRIRQGNPEFRLRRDNTIEDKRASSHSNISNYEWINGKWLVNTREMGLVTLVIRADNTLMMNDFEGRFEIEDDIMYCYFETENIRLPLNKTNQTIDFGKGYILRKETDYFNSDNPNHEIKEDDEINESHYIMDEEKSDCYLVENTTYFHTDADSNTITKQYLVKDDYVFVSEEKNGFGYVEFTNSNGQITKGWLNMKDLYNP